MRKILCLLLSVILLLSLCACNADNQTLDVPDEPTLPDLIYGTWYPQPDVSDLQIEIYEDGICVVNGQQWNWTTKSISEDLVVLTAGEGDEEFNIEFKYLNTNVPVLAEKHFGWSVKDLTIWDHTGTWYNEETEVCFSLTLFAMQEAGCKISLKAGLMIVETTDGYTLNVTAEQCVVTDSEGNSTIFVPSDET